MLEFEDVMSDKNRARHRQDYADAFSYYFEDVFGKKPSFCCTFSDFDKLKYFNQEKNKEMKLTKFKVLYKSSDILWYKKDKRTYRSYAGKASDKFIEEFLKYHKKDVFKDADRFIKKLGDVAVTEKVYEKETITKDALTVKETIELIDNSDLEGLKKFEDDTRKGVVKAVENRRVLLELQSI